MMQISLTHLREVWKAKPLSSQLTTLALITAGSGTRDYQVKRADSEPCLVRQTWTLAVPAASVGFGDGWMGCSGML